MDTMGHWGLIRLVPSENLCKVCFKITPPGDGMLRYLSTHPHLSLFEDYPQGVLNPQPFMVSLCFYHWRWRKPEGRKAEMLALEVTNCRTAHAQVQYLSTTQGRQVSNSTVSHIRECKGEQSKEYWRNRGSHHRGDHIWMGHWRMDRI